MEANPINHAETLAPWDLSTLRAVRMSAQSGHIFLQSKSVRQISYAYSDGVMKDLSLRFSIGVPSTIAPSQLVWLDATAESGCLLKIGVEPSYIYYRSKALVNPAILRQLDPQITPVEDFVTASVGELEALLRFTVNGLTDASECPSAQPCHFMSLDHNKRSRLVVVGAAKVLAELEEHARNYCPAYWQNRQSMGTRLCYDLRVRLLLTRRYWTSSEVAEIECGDVLTLLNAHPDQGVCGLRVITEISGGQFQGYKLEAIMELNDDDVALNFRADDFEGALENAQSTDIPAHEHIELEVYAGKTKIPFNDLCSIQSGTLIELSQHEFPMVTFKVNGVPILEGELVRFQDQLMVQVTKRLD